MNTYLSHPQRNQITELADDATCAIQSSALFVFVFFFNFNFVQWELQLLQVFWKEKSGLDLLHHYLEERLFWRIRVYDFFKTK